MKSLYIYMSILFAMSSSLTIHAQEDKTTEKPKNLLDYSMLDAYRPNHNSFSGSNVLMKHLYITGGVDFVRQTSKGSFDYNTGTGGYLNVGTSFSPLWGGRISFGYSNLDEKKMIHSLRTVYGTADALFDLSSFIYGYKPYRLIDSKAFVGLGWETTRYEGINTASPLFSGGLQFGLQLNSHTRLSLEPYVLLGKNRVPNQADENWHQYDMNYGVKVGLQYSLNSWNEEGSKEKSVLSGLFDDSFIDIGVSANSVSKTKDVSAVDSRLASQLSAGGEIALGRWITPMAGLRIGLGLSHTNWGSYVATSPRLVEDGGSTSETALIVSDPSSVIGLRQETYFDASLELLFNPLAGWRDASDDIAHLTFHGGLTIGSVKKYTFTSTESARLNTTGWKVGPDFSLDMTPSVALYISPNFYKTSYAVPYSNYPESESYDDNRTQIQVGLRIRTNSLDARHGLIPRLCSKERINQLAQKNQLAAQTIRVGGALSVLKSYTHPMADSNSYGSLGFTVSGIYSLTSMSSLRASLSYNELNVTDLIPYEKFSGHIAKVGEIGVDYLFNLSDLYATNHYPFLKIEPFIGIIMAKGIQERDYESASIEKDTAFGYHTGLQVSAPIWSQLNLFVQGEYKDYGKSFMHYLPTDYHRTLTLSIGAYWTF